MIIYLCIGMVLVSVSTYLYLRNRETVAECGHKTKKKDKITVWVKGEEKRISVTLKKQKNNKYKFCHKCFEKMSIRCAWCGDTILIDEPITLYSPCNKDYKFPEYTIYYNKEENQVVGCLSWDCADSGIDRAGFWMYPGEVKRIQSGIEIMMNNPGKVMVIGDVNDPNDLGTFY